MMNDTMQSVGSDRRVRVGVVLALFLLSAFLFIATVRGIKELRYVGGGVPVTNTVTVSGEGEEFAVPDIATFSFGVIEQAKTVEAAQKTATEKMNAVLDYLKGEGIEDKDIRTTGYNVYPRYDYVQEVCTALRCPPGRQVLLGFEVSQNVEVKVRDTEKAGKLLSGVGEWGANNISGLTFTVDDEEKLHRDARAEAIEDARSKAEQLADDLDVRLVRVVSFSESGPGMPYPILFAKDAAMGMGGAERGETAPSIPTGENRIVSTVNITYEIR